MVVKPLDFISKGRRGIAQPAIKCRGPEYLRIIYGPEYLLPGNLERLKSRARRKAITGRQRVCFGRRGSGALYSQGATAQNA
jgi:hypothetical protein